MDQNDHSNPYIENTTVLSDTCITCHTKHQSLSKLLMPLTIVLTYVHHNYFMFKVLKGHGHVGVGKRAVFRIFLPYNMILFDHNVVEFKFQRSK